jgi:hypothetical protein
MPERVNAARPPAWSQPRFKPVVRPAEDHRHSLQPLAATSRSGCWPPGDRRCQVIMGQTAQHDQSLWTVRSYAFIAQHTEQTLQFSPQANLSIRERSLLGYIAITIALARKG